MAAVAAAIAIAATPARAQAPAAACPNADLLLAAVGAAAAEAAIGCLVNAERASRGLVPAAPSAVLETVAQRHAGDMVTRRYFAHVSPSGGNVQTRARRVGYITSPCWILGEDLGWAPPDASTAAAVVAAWMDSPSHRSVILEPLFRELGVAIVTRAPTGSGPGATFVLEMGAMTECANGVAGGTIRARARARIRVS